MWPKWETLFNRLGQENPIPFPGDFTNMAYVAPGATHFGLAPWPRHRSGWTLFAGSSCDSDPYHRATRRCNKRAIACWWCSFYPVSKYKLCKIFFKLFWCQTYIIIIPIFCFVGAVADAEFQALGGWRQGDFEGECIEDYMSTSSRSIGPGVCTEDILLALPIIPGHTDNDLLLEVDILHLDGAHDNRFLILDDHILQGNKVAFYLLSV